MMKKYLSLIFITLAIAGSSCKKDYLNLTDNPNVPSVASPNLLLAGALKTTADIVNGGDYVQYAAWVGYLSQSTSFQPFAFLEQYTFTTSDFQNIWIDNYLNLSNYNALEGATPEPNYHAIAEIMSVFDYEALVDNYNNVPYSSALKGANTLSPIYDSGRSIYLDLMKRLDGAIILIQKAPASALNPGTSDIMFGGTMGNWIKFANTLKLRLAIRESTNPSLSADYATLSTAVKATSSLGYLDGTTAATLNPGYLNNDANGGQQSPLWRYYGFSQTGAQQVGRQEYQANSFAASFFYNTNDPRLNQVYSASSTPMAYLATGISAGGAVYVQKGDTLAVSSTTFGDSQPPTGTINGTVIPVIVPSLVGPGLLQSATQNAIIMSSSEALFLQAEGAVKGLIGGGSPAAQSLYNAGIAASFANLNASYITLNPDPKNAGKYLAPTIVSPAESASTYAAQTAVAFPLTGSPAAQVAAIITQKWAALDVYGAFEAFNEERRTGIPNVPTSIYPGANAPNQVTRVLYPFVEYETNANSVNAEGTINKFTSKIFWAQ